jgi:hypothetical protein
MRFNLDNYETVESRLAKFWDEFPNGQIFTSIHHYDDNKVVFKAEVYKDIADPRPVATGFAEETRDSNPVNKTSHVENAETSSIGRALANWKFQSKTAPRPSREEMNKVARQQDAIVEQVKQVFPSATDATPAIKDPSAKASPAQLGKIRAMMNGTGLSTRADQHDYIAEIVNRSVPNLDALTKGEADTVIKALDARSKR